MHFQNSKGDTKAFLVSLQWSYFFREDDKLKLQAHHSYIDYSSGISTLNETGALARMLNRVDLASQEVVDVVTAPTVEQRFWLGMEYLF
jgi:hypothetical protein